MPVPVGTRPIPLGAAVGIPVAPAPPRSNSDDNVDAPRKKKPAGMGLVIALGVVSVVVGSVFVAVLVISTSKKKPPATPIAATEETSSANPGESANPSAAANPVAAVNPVAETPQNPPPVKPVSVTPAVEPSAPTAKRLPTAFANVKKFSDAVSVRRLRSASVKLELVSIAFAADETGAPVRTGSSKPQSDDEGDTPDQPAGKFIVVVMQISNVSKGSLTYRSWNQAGETAALLADDHNNLLALVPPNRTPAVSRLTQSADIPSGKMIKDTLVFEAPPGEFAKLRLVLPHAAISGLGPGYFGWEAPPDILTSAAAAPTTAARGPTTEPAEEPEAMDEPGQAVAGPAKPKANSDGMMSKEDFLKSINGPDETKDKNKPAKASDGKVGEAPEKPKMETEKMDAEKMEQDK